MRSQGSGFNFLVARQFEVLFLQAFAVCSFRYYGASDDPTVRVHWKIEVLFQQATELVILAQ